MPLEQSFERRTADQRRLKRRQGPGIPEPCLFFLRGTGHGTNDSTYYNTSYGTGVTLPFRALASFWVMGRLCTSASFAPGDGMPGCETYARFSIE